MRIREVYPLSWPEGIARTPLRERDNRPAWKKSELEALEILETELNRFHTLMAIITRKDPHDIRTAPDPSIALHFTREREEDFSWQHALEITNPAPTIEEIERAFRKLAAPHHPDRGGDIETYHALDRYKKAALAYVNRMSGASFDFQIGCDKFNHARWNITAIANSIRSLRQLERDGTSGILERAMQGFAALGEGKDVPNVQQTHA